jgi:hypothetical protein
MRSPATNKLGSAHAQTAQAPEATFAMGMPSRAAVHADPITNRRGRARQNTAGLGVLGVVLAAVTLAPLRLQAQPTLPTTFLLPSSAADTSQPGFVWRIHQVTTPQPNDNGRTEAQLAGLLGANVADPNAQGIALAPASPASPATAPISFNINTVINLSAHPDDIYNGYFVPDSQMPGLPGTTGSYDNAAAEVLFWLDMPAGSNTFAVNSDDGFRMTLGGANPSDQFAVRVGEFNGGRGADYTFFVFKTAQAGLYSARCTWEQGIGGANIEMFSLRSDGAWVLLNDTANGGIPAYRAVTAPARAYARKVSPAPGGAARADAPIVVELVDGPNPIALSSVKLSVDGTAVALVKSKTGNVITATYTRPSLFAAGTHTVVFSYTEAASPVNVPWSFTTLDYQGPTGNLYEFVIAPNISWPDAKAAAEQRSFGCIHGHLVTLTSADEDAFVEYLRQQYVAANALPAGEVWAGGYQLPTQATTYDGWFWVNNEGPIPPYPNGSAYANWNQSSGEPNDCCNTWGVEDNEENYLGLGFFGPWAGWIDDDASHGNIVGYAVEYDALVVAIDIKPGGTPNVINLGGNGKIPVAILSTATFDAATVDPATITFGHSGTEALPVSYSLSDANGDGRKDLVCQFNTQDAGLLCGDTSAVLKARTKMGCPVRGADSIQTLPCSPFTLSLQAMQDVHELTDVYLTVNAVANNCAPPAISQHILLQSLDLRGHVRWSANFQNVPFAPAANTASTGDVQSSSLQHHQQFQAQVQVQSCQGNNTLVLRQQGVVLLRPDVAVTSVNAPASVYPGVIVNVTALVAELNGDLGASGYVYLMEGATVLDQASGFLGPKATASVVFSVVLNTLGTHQLRVVVANETPADYDLSNNEKDVTIEVTQPPAYYYAYYGHYMDEFSEDYNWPWWQWGTNYHKVNDESLSEYLYIPAVLNFPLTDVSIQVSADGAAVDSFDLPNLDADSSSPAPYYYAQAYRNLAPGFDFYVYTYSYPWFQTSYAQFTRSAADDVFYSVYHNIYWGDGGGPSASKFGTYLNATSSVATRFVIQAGSAAYGGSVNLPLSSYSWSTPYDYEDPTSGAFDRYLDQGNTTSGSASGFVTP